MDVCFCRTLNINPKWYTLFTESVREAGRPCIYIYGKNEFILLIVNEESLRYLRLDIIGLFAYLYIIYVFIYICLYEYKRGDKMWIGKIFLDENFVLQVKRAGHRIFLHLLLGLKPS